MNKKILFPALFLAVMFSFVACDDSSSASDKPSCEASWDANSVTVVLTQDGQTVSEKSVIDGDYIVVTSTYIGFSQSEWNDLCKASEKSLKRVADAEVTCKDYAMVSRAPSNGATLSVLKERAEMVCDAVESGAYDFDE
ncbi:hypothetical protein [uncultured Fibrobacter sp.]|uniref:hypothetical protein n=1 Tax=uncultured Fibrobacter sp. TaxID=261512 RepID=UPI0026153B07|nr:hypothetical protein [uncultured Fibrobacter sp.]